MRESADVIETRSLGMKGTCIRILNEYLERKEAAFDEVDPFRKIHDAFKAIAWIERLMMQCVPGAD